MLRPGTAAWSPSARETAGDLDGDWIDDLLITAPSIDGSRAGATYIFLGDEALPSGVIAASSADIILEGDAGDRAGRVWQRATSTRTTCP